MRLMLILAVAATCVALEALPARAESPSGALPTVTLGHHHYDVYYRNCEHEPWRFAGSYDCIHDAEGAARRLDRRGFQVSIRHHH